MGEKEPEEKSKRPKGKRDRIAYHESGHVVINLLMGLPFDEVSIDNYQKDVYQDIDGQREKLIYVLTKGVTWPKTRTESVNKNALAGNLDLREVLSSMAGPEAETMFVGKIDDEAQLGAKSDFQTIMVCCRAAVSLGRPIADWKPTIMEEKIVRAVALQARDILEKNWGRVEVIANALIERKKLTYLEAESLFIKV